MAPAKFRGLQLSKEIRADYLLLSVLLIQRKAGGLYDYSLINQINLCDKSFFCEGFVKYMVIDAPRLKSEWAKIKNAK